jgi:hypothetical protein
MMPPTSIDGTDITGATIDGTDVTEITVDGQTVFTAGPPIIDDFEDGNLSEYVGATGDWSVSGSSPLEGSFSLLGQNAFNAARIFSTSLSNIPSRGDTFDYLYDTSNNNNFDAVHFGINPSNPNENYVAAIGSFGFRIAKDGTDQNDGSSGGTSKITTFGSGRASLTRVEVNWGNPVIEMKVFDDNDNLLASDSISDTDYNSGGIGFRQSNATSGSGHQSKFDRLRIL